MIINTSMTGWLTEPQDKPYQLEVATSEEEFPAAYLFICKKPGRTCSFASIDPSGYEAHPFEEWETIERIDLFESEKREKIYSRKKTP